MHRQQQTNNGTSEQLLLAIGIEFHTRKLVIPERATLDQWISCGAFLAKCKDAVDFWRADWIEYGRRHFGAKALAHAVEQLELDLAQLKRSDLLNDLVERRDDLSKEHHFILARAKLDQTAQKMWIQFSVKEQLSARELEESIRAGQVTKLYVEDYQRSGGFTSVQGLLSMYRLWRRQIGDEWMNWNDQEMQAFLNLVLPIEQFADQVRAYRDDPKQVKL